VASLWGVNYLSLVTRLAGNRTALMSHDCPADKQPATEVKEPNP
jgi:hypothetical protein